MGECLKAGFAMILPHAAAPHAAKWKVGIAKLDDRVINTAGAE